MPGIRTIRRRVRGTAPPPSRYLLIVTPTDPSSASPLHIESGGETDGEHWVLMDRGGEVVRRRGVPCLVTVHDLDETDPELATVAWLQMDADGNVTTRPLGADAPEGGADMSETRSSTDAATDPRAIFDNHRATGEPLDSDTKRILVDAGLTPAEDWSQRGGDLWWHAPTFPDLDEAEDLPVVAAGDPCPACGGTIVVDGRISYTDVPVLADGTPTDEGQGGDFEWDDSGPHCRDCGQRVQVEW